jgi:hypothetical protein
MQHRVGLFLCATSVFLHVSVVPVPAEISTTEAPISTEVAQRKIESTQVATSRRQSGGPRVFLLFF